MAQVSQQPVRYVKGGLIYHVQGQAPLGKSLAKRWASRCMDAAHTSQSESPKRMNIQLVSEHGPYALPQGQLHSVLVARCAAGRSKVVVTDEINKDALKEDVLNGPFHSVLGDRISSLGKPYREMVLYDVDQAFPEFVVISERIF